MLALAGCVWAFIYKENILWWLIVITWQWELVTLHSTFSMLSYLHTASIIFYGRSDGTLKTGLWFYIFGIWIVCDLFVVKHNMRIFFLHINYFVYLHRCHPTVKSSIIKRTQCLFYNNKKLLILRTMLHTFSHTPNFLFCFNTFWCLLSDVPDPAAWIIIATPSGLCWSPRSCL